MLVCNRFTYILNNWCISSMLSLQLWVCQVPPSVCGEFTGDCGGRRDQELDQRWTTCNRLRSRHSDPRCDPKDQRLGWVSVAQKQLQAAYSHRADSDTWVIMQRVLVTFRIHLCTCFCGRYQQMMQTLKNTMILVVESLINKFEEDQMRKEEMHREKQHSQSNSHYSDNCSDSDSSFNQVRDTVHTLRRQ